MKLLFAGPDRDLLMTYKKLLEREGYEVTTAFDGVQTVEKLRGEPFGLIILDRRIPRVSCREVLIAVEAAKMPSILLLDGRLTPAELLSDVSACSYMRFPFFPHELLQRTAEVLERASSDEVLNVCGVEIITNKFRSRDGTRFTNEEINIIKASLAGKSTDIHGMSSYVNAINNKLEKLGKGSRIQYILDNGYRLVNSNE